MRLQDVIIGHYHALEDCFSLHEPQVPCIAVHVSFPETDMLLVHTTAIAALQSCPTVQCQYTMY